jgi:hypothetical protein
MLPHKHVDGDVFYVKNCKIFRLDRLRHDLLSLRGLCSPNLELLILKVRGADASVKRGA